MRRPKVDYKTAEFDSWVVPGDPLLSHYLTALSAAFPNGEDFFVQSVRNYRSQLPAEGDLRSRVKGFIGQEAMHGREHRLLNERLAELGYPTLAQDEALLRVSTRMQKLPKQVQLAITAASEHFTTVLARAVLSDEQTRRTLFPTPEVQLLITWHALEELEHKDVAFDVFEEISGSYAVRQLGALVAILGFGSVVAAGYIRAVFSDRRHLTPGTLRRNVYNLRRQQMVGWRAGLALLTYVRPGFHPRRVDTDSLVVEWRERLAPAMAADTARAS